jgi:endonuclease/exonuclease/phosphatase family metal-dependent hydrolase
MNQITNPLTMKTYFSIAFLMLLFFSGTAQHLNVMTYNIRYATENDGVNAWSVRKTKVFELIKKYDPDLIGVQEALHSQLTDILDACPEYAYVGVGRDDGKAAGEFSAILYKKDKFVILEDNTFWLSEAPQVPGSKSWDAAITRVATWAKMKDKVSGKTFLIINTHFDHIGKEARTNSATLLKKEARVIGKKLPTLIIGDFNCQRDEPPYQVMMQKDAMKLVDPAPANPTGTYCTFEVDRVPCVAIDYIFHTRHWNAKNYRVISDNDGSHYPSDHLPVIVDVSLKR